MEFPVLVGSQALQEYGWILDEPKLHDWDIICTDDQNKALQKLRDTWSWSRCETFEVGDIKIDCPEFRGTKKLIYNFCNKPNTKQKILDHPKLGKLIIPELQILYALKKAHIHRVLNHHPSNLENVKTWRIQVFQYNWMRQQLGYKRMDEIIYHPNSDLVINPQSDDSALDIVTRQIFSEEFDAVTKRVGDTNISMDKTEDEFFADGVTRFINHDELHRQVAQVCRGTDELLFPKFIKPTQPNQPQKVEMDQTLFLRADRNTQIQTIKEEIITLFLERKLIPTMVRNRDLGICYDGPNPERRSDEMIEIIAHFMTNLCGQKHHWLRRWCIDHFQFFDMSKNTTTYPNDEIDKIAIQISRIQDLTEKLATMEGMTLTDFIFKGHKLRILNPNDKYQPEIEVTTHDLTLSEYEVKNFSYFQHKKFGKDGGCMKFKCVDLTYPSEIDSYTLDYFYDPNPIMTLILRRMTTPAKDENGNTYKNQYIFRVGNTIYDPFSNIGILHEGGATPVILFRVGNIINEYQYNYITKKDNKEYAIHVEQLPIDNPTVTAENKAWVKNTFNYWYYSELDPSCGYQNKLETSRSYLSSYGSMSYQLSRLFETLARYHLDVIRDERKFKRGEQINGEPVEGDSDQFTSSSDSESD